MMRLVGDGEGETPEQKAAKMLMSRGVPKRYAMLSRKTWEEKYGPWEKHGSTSVGGERVTFAQMCQRWIVSEAPDEYHENRDWLLMVFGQYGRQKTGFAVSVMLEYLRHEWIQLARKRREIGMKPYMTTEEHRLMKSQDQEIRFVDCEDMLADIEAGMGDDVGVDDRTRVYLNAPRLVIDDVGTVRAGRGESKGGAWWKEKLAYILRHRHSHVLPTIVTSNVAQLADLAQIDPSLVRRLTSDLTFKIATQKEVGS